MVASCSPRPPARLAEWLLFVALAPPLEEVVFRGGVQRWLLTYRTGQRQWAGITGANVGASVLFAVTHLAAHSSLIGLSTLFPSLAFGWLRDRTGRLTGPILLHAYYNACHLGAAALPAAGRWLATPSS